jgi:hypothetical protein
VSAISLAIDAFKDVDFASYSVLNWLRGQPIVHLFKSARYRSIDSSYRNKPPRKVSFAEPRDLAGANMLLTIAFEDAELTDWQIRLVQKYLPATAFIVIDNSVSDSGAEAIHRVCASHQCNYIRTPQNPWVGSPSRSHGIALNWAWENVVRAAGPKAFGFIDADIFPLERTDPFDALKAQDFYGVIRYEGNRWFLWPGFCFFNFSAVAQRTLNFSQAWFLGLDTGGGNWNELYRHYNLAGLSQINTEFFPYKPGIEISEGPMQRCGPWIHEVGQMGHPQLAADKRAVLRRMIEQRLA